MNKPITIAIAEDHEFVRKGFISVLEDYAHIKVIFEVENGKELLSRLKRVQPKLILLDIDMPEMNGLEVLVKVKKLYPAIKIIMISAHYKRAFIIESISKGANAFLPKNCKVDEVVKTINTVYSDGEYFNREINAIIKSERNKKFLSKISEELSQGTKQNENQLEDKNKLTDREIVIIKMICAKKTNKEIAGTLSLSEKTIEANRSKIYRKTGSEDLIDLIKFTVNNKIIGST